MTKKFTRESYKEFYDTTEAYYREEPRAFCYDFALELVKRAQSDTSQSWYTNESTVKAIVLLLYCWNFAARKTKELTFDEIKAILGKTESTLRKLKDMHFLKNMDDDCKDKVKEVYEEFRKKLGQTGASKALSLLNQDLFVMWDTKIRKELRGRRIICRISNGEKPEHYLRFLEELKNISIRFDLKSKIPPNGCLAKKIDEFHYLKL